ncbi:hypothetical protein FUA26_14195 [Seonamhaeicola algicola]|uniref:Uncharacterized protein n=1 Tax=Seonamhaeicola algicola TaxID=1719036 RepID=A0A5C7ABW9_9FLAO|nr:hypothetical protein [Seonamhaeicola algicola]TXE06126.1 hypothetical protein FUA26_14195 [Seonamhaeicola algicola]
MKQLLFLVVLMVGFFNTQCKEDDSIESNTCDFTILVDEEAYTKGNFEGLNILDASIEADCLQVTFGASGCSGTSWEFQLIDSGTVAESLPEQRYMKLNFKNNEACLAYFERTVSFNLLPIRVKGSHKIQLHLEGVNAPLTYNY